MFLVTGGAGFIGSHTVRTLQARGERVRVLDDLSTGSRERLDPQTELVVGSITDADAVARALQGVRRVIHLAAKVSVPESVDDPLGCDDVNVVGFLTVLRAARATGVERVVYASSCSVYGSVPGLPKRETDAPSPESPYAASKLADEAYGSAFTALGLPCVGLRYFNVFGPGQDPRGPYGAVIPAFVSRALRGEPLRIHGDGEQGRDFVHVRDVARANVLAAVTPRVGGRVLNVCGGRMLTVNRVAEHVVAEVGAVPVEHGPERPGDVRLSVGDPTAAREALGFEASVSFEEGLPETVRALADGQRSSSR